MDSSSNACLLLALCVAWGCRDDRSPGGPAPTPASVDRGDADTSFARGRPVFLRIFKEPAELEIFFERAPGGRFQLLKAFPICRFSGELGPKLREGDRQSPEGFYFVPRSRMNPNSRFHLAFDLGFPNAYDRHHGRTGSHLMVHGGCASVGCYAMTDPGIEEIYGLADAALSAEQPYFRVHVFPFRMTGEKVERHRDSPWYEFWQNLREGYERFERDGRPPNVEVEGGRYVFTSS